MTILDLIREAQTKGKKAYGAGVSAYDCPYSYTHEGAQAIAWERAWRDAQIEKGGKAQ